MASPVEELRYRSIYQLGICLDGLDVVTIELDMEEYVYVGGSSAAAMAVAGDLEGVARVYEHVEPLVRCARAEQVEEELEASVALLDACAAARDGLRAMRACALDLEVAVRRGDGDRARAAARAYARLARKARADVVKTQRQQQRRPSQGAGSVVDGAGVGRSLEEARRVTVAVLERVVTALSRRAVAVSSAPAGSSSRCWSACIVAKAFMRKRTRVAACEDAAATETTAMTALVPSSKESVAASWRATTQRELRALGETIGHLEDGLELLFRRLVQCRAFLLDLCSS